MTTQTTTTTHFGAEPHGGVLVDAFTPEDDRSRLRDEAKSLPKRELNAREASDVEMIAIGGYSPLAGFMSEADYTSVVHSMYLASELPWTIPVTLSVSNEEKATARSGSRIALCWHGEPIAVMSVEEQFERDARVEAENVYRTTEEAHPGVAALYREHASLIAGPIEVFGALPNQTFPEHRLPPRETRRLFAEREWRTVVGFQTRNPVHRAHEYLQKCALEIVDGLLLHPLVGETKSDDIPADVRMRSYEVLLAKYYPPERVLLAVNPAAMRYGGPREAIFHALIRKNFGCTHFIVGRDHAGVGSYYGPYDAQHIFLEFEPGSLGIQPLFFENSFYCKVCGNMATQKTCPHGPEDRVSLSGTQVREMLRNGIQPPPEFSRAEVAQVLSDAMQTES
ncbi:MAG TPA: sulfate adenylyltransferase [Chloroflexota bacterium]